MDGSDNITFDPAGMLDRPPWHRRRQWREAVDAVTGHLRRCAGSGHPMRARALAIRKQMERLSPALDTMSAALCPSCRENCCELARVHYTQTDLVFMVLVGVPLPPGQPVNTFDERCRYLAPSGCTLDRLARPWQCVRFLCRPMESMASRRGPAEIAGAVQLIHDIDACRTELLGQYRQLTATGPSPPEGPARDHPDD